MNVLRSQMLSGLLDVESQRRKVLANNLANLDTPGFKTGRLPFDRALEQALDGNEDAPGEVMKGELSHPLYPDMGPDGNDVSLERELVRLNENSMRTKVYLSMLDFRIRQMRAAIGGK